MFLEKPQSFYNRTLLLSSIAWATPCDTMGERQGTVLAFIMAAYERV